ncbi:MAG TPA: ABC transporter permease, partial [Vicinamibacterales bacterium]
RFRTGGSGFASHEFLTTELAMERSSAVAPSLETERAFRDTYARKRQELERALEAESSVAAVTYALTPPGGELAAVVEVEGAAVPAGEINYNIVEGARHGHLARFNRVDLDFFDAFEVPVMLGRGFATQDAGTDRVVISRTLATTVFGADNPLGRRIKYVGRSREAIFDGIAMDRWLEIIGVVANFPANDVQPIGRVYHPVDTGNLYPATIAVRVREGDPEAAAVLLRDTSVAVNARLQVRDISTADIIVRREQGMFRMIGVTVGLVMTSVIILTAAGIYALMSFTVTRRRREIGIRAALGANRNRLLAGIFARAAAQLMAGAAVGLVASLGVEQILEGEMFQGRGTIILPIVIALMSAVGLLAALGPARRGLRIQPIEALREE